MKKGFLLLIACVFFISCKKGWLDAKSNKSYVVPTTIKDYQSLLDNTTNLFNASQPALGEVGSADFYVTSTNWQSLTTIDKAAYIWAPDIYQGATVVNDWNFPYKRILTENIVLEGIQEITPDAASLLAWQNVKGSALFLRAFDFYCLADLFAKPYNSSTATADLGIPLRLTGDVNELSVRATVQETYDQIISDLLAAKDLLPIIPLYKTRPSKPAAFALLARTYLAMRQYDKALLYADSSLSLNNALMDYNSSSFINPTSTSSSFIRFNPEVIFHSTLFNYVIFSSSRLIVEPALYQLYHANDQRRSLFFTTNAGNITFRGSYSGLPTLFGGLSNDEMFLIRAECYARVGNTSFAMNDLNALLIKRWKAGTFTPLTASSSTDAISKILVERRKELIFRGIRWSDLRRLNIEGANITLARTLNAQTYTLLPNDNKYVLPIPDYVIQMTGMPQNMR